MPDRSVSPVPAGLTRRTLMRRGALGAAAFAAAELGAGPFGRLAAAAALRTPDSLPDPTRPAGTPTDALPFEHIICVMMENHSFDNLLGVLPIAGQHRADGLRFNRAGVALNTNPGPNGPVQAFAFPNTQQGPYVSQTWNATHQQIDGGRMDGFVASNENMSQTMGYYPPSVIPFAYSFATTFCVGNRWFCSAPCQTYPNRRFLMAGTAYGDITTSFSTLTDPPPPNGTIFDRLHQYGITWRNYFTDLPQTGIIPTIIEKYPTNVVPIQQFLNDCGAGTLPQVSFVDPEFGLLGEIGSILAENPQLAEVGARLSTIGGDEEDPQDLAWGEAWAYAIVNAVLDSPAWPQTLFIYIYDEHGGYYDHVPPPAAIPPDSIPPDLTATDVPGGYDVYGPRIPAVVMSPYARPNAVTNVVHDHTSVLATIEAKWNLPALTYRDANAATVRDFLDPRHAAFLEPPAIAAPSNQIASILADLFGPIQVPASSDSD